MTWLLLPCGRSEIVVVYEAALNCSLSWSTAFASGSVLRMVLSPHLTALLSMVSTTPRWTASGRGLVRNTATACVNWIFLWCSGPNPWWCVCRGSAGRCGGRWALTGSYQTLPFVHAFRRSWMISSDWPHSQQTQSWTS